MIITDRYAFKIPRLHSWYWFIRGCMANYSEQTWSHWTESSTVPPNPVLHSLPGGLLNIYRTATPYPPDGPITPEMFGMFGDAKHDNLGYVDGRLVLLDYDCSTSHPAAERFL